jgi:ribosomal protein L25 (general stress protein Ctc)
MEGREIKKMLENQKGRNHLIDLDVDGRIILIWVLNK